MPFWVFYVTCFFLWTVLESLLYPHYYILWWYSLDCILFNLKTGILMYQKPLLHIFSPGFLIIYMLNIQKLFSWFILFYVINLSPPFPLFVLDSEKYGIFFQLFLITCITKLLTSAFMQIISKITSCSFYPFCSIPFILWLTCFLSLSEENKFLEFCCIFCIVVIHSEFLFSCFVYVDLSTIIEALLKCLTFLCYLFIFKNEAPKILGGFVWEWVLSVSQPHCRVIGQVSWHFLCGICQCHCLYGISLEPFSFSKTVSKSPA